MATTSDRRRSIAGKRILVVEDMMMIARDLQRTLEQAGCEVVGPSATLDDALVLAEGEALDGALLDIDLRGENSSPVASVLLRRGVPVVFTTGYEADSLPAGELRACPLLGKPVDHERLTRVLCDMLEERSRQSGQGSVPERLS